MSVSLPQSESPNQFSSVGVLLVGHGTRNLAGQEEFRQLFTQFAELMQPIPSELGFLELAEPDIAAAVKRFSDRAVSHILVVPVILFTAGHAESDIPNAVQEAVELHNLICIGQTAALECSAEVLELSAERFRQAACTAKCQSGCCGEICSSAAWLMVGRGSSSAEATAKTREFCRLRWQLTPTHTSQAAFIHGQTPTVDQAMDECASNCTTHVIVQPHLLFSGLLMNELRQQVKQRQEQNPHQRWIITETLGADSKLAELLARRAKKALDFFLRQKSNNLDQTAKQ
jgi:sirohydrochlorin cobaltochelatase